MDIQQTTAGIIGLVGRSTTRSWYSARQGLFLSAPQRISLD